MLTALNMLQGAAIIAATALARLHHDAAPGRAEEEAGCANGEPEGHPGHSEQGGPRRGRGRGRRHRVRNPLLPPIGTLHDTGFKTALPFVRLINDYAPAQGPSHRTPSGPDTTRPHYFIRRNTTR